jgi:hypothetical protein
MLSLDRGDVILALQIKPELCAVPEITTESHGCVGGNRAATVEDIRDTADGTPKSSASRFVLRLRASSSRFRRRPGCAASGMV